MEFPEPPLEGDALEAIDKAAKRFLDRKIPTKKGTRELQVTPIESCR
jgi:hypothetical protein